MKFELEPYYRDLTDQELLSDLDNVAKVLNKNSITRKEYDNNGKYSSTTLIKRFGSWNASVEKAGLKQSRIYGVSNEIYFQNLQDVWVSLGRQPRYQEMHKPFSKYSVDAYARRFGSWRKTLESFIEYVNTESNNDSNKISNSNYCENKRQKTSRTISWRMRFLVMRRDDFKCRLCGNSPALKPGLVLHVDHVIPWSEGGETVMDNLQTLCEKCNVGKSNLPIFENGAQ